MNTRKFAVKALAASSPALRRSDKTVWYSECEYRDTTKGSASTSAVTTSEGGGAQAPGVDPQIQAFLGQAGPGDYIAILAYLAPTAENLSSSSQFWRRLSARPACCKSPAPTG